MRLANHISPITKAAQSRGSDGEEVADWYKPEGSAVYSGPFKLTALDIDAGSLTFEPNEKFFRTEAEARPAPRSARSKTT